MTFFFDACFGSRAYQQFRNGCAGRVIGIFSSAVYCKLEDGGIILFHDSKYGIIPFGAGIKNIQLFLAKSRFCVNSAFQCVNFSFTDTVSGLNIIFHPLKKGSTSIFMKEDILRLPWHENIVSAEDLLKSLKPGCFSTIFSLINLDKDNCPDLSGITGLMKCNVFNSLFKGILQNNAELIETSLSSLIGLGYGLTPTMDDILTGLAYLIRFNERYTGELYDGCCLFLDLLFADRLFSRTSDISSAYFRSAASGEIFSLFDKLIFLLLNWLPEEAGEIFKAFLAIGSDSGGNILTGILMGIYFLSNLNII